MEAVLIIGHDMNLKNYNYQKKYVVGVDEGAFLALHQGIRLDLAIGDFDSITKEELALLQAKVPTKVLHPIKDDTDTQAALEVVKDAKKITILGGIQGHRIEHFLANLIMMKNNSKIEMLDDYSRIFTMDKSFFIPKEEYTYISFFALEDTKNLTLKGFKYPLTNYELKTYNPLTISNEWVQPIGQVQFTEGRLLVILSKSDHVKL